MRTLQCHPVVIAYTYFWYFTKTQGHPFNISRAISRSSIPYPTSVSDGQEQNSLCTLFHLRYFLVTSNKLLGQEMKRKKNKNHLPSCTWFQNTIAKNGPSHDTYTFNFAQLFFIMDHIFCSCVEMVIEGNNSSYCHLRQ